MYLPALGCDVLNRLYIKNFAIIDELTVAFSAGLNLITGETGVGKSVIVNAIKLLLGGKFSKEYIRTGADKVIVEGIFNFERNELIIRRNFSVSGASRSFIDDEPASLEKIREVTQYLMDLHGQHEQQRLLDINQHIDYLDAYGSYQNELDDLNQLYLDIEKYHKKLQALRLNENKVQEKEELYKFQLQEIEALNLSISEENEIQDAFYVLSNAAIVREWVSTILDLTEDGEQSVQNNLVQVEKLLQKSANIDRNLNSFLPRIDQIHIELNDILGELNHYIQAISTDEQALDEINQKISYVEMLKRKYGGSYSQVIEYRDFIKQWLHEKSGHKTEIKLLEERLIFDRQKYMDAANQVSSLRRSTARLFELEIAGILSGMNMKNTAFSVRFFPDDINRFTAKGIDNCQFYISANLGEDPKPLNRIISGGEISRIMLAIKLALQGKDKTASLVFDEVDTGISGATAEKIGDLIYKLSHHQQILCITHLPQIASKGNYHLKVYKEHLDGITSSKIKALSPDERILEIAGLISGKKITTAGRQQAMKLLEESHG